MISFPETNRQHLRIVRPLINLASDRVFQVLVLAVIALILADSRQVMPSLQFTIQAYWDILPFLALAVVFAASIKASGADRIIATVFSGRESQSILLAALAGALSPFCSCGVVPLIAALLRARVPLAPVMAFWIASPIMDPEMFVLTAAGINIEFALAKTLATFVMGLTAGFAVLALERRISDFSQPLMDAGPQSTCYSQPGNATVRWSFWRVANRRQVFLDELITTGWFLTKWLILAFFLESLMVAYLSAAWIAGLLGSGNWYEIPVAAAVGVPAYLNGYAAIPLVSGLMELGMNPGAALAFMTAGAVSSIPAATAVFVLVKRSVFVAYILLGLAGSILTGLTYMAVT